MSPYVPASWNLSRQKYSQTFFSPVDGAQCWYYLSPAIEKNPMRASWGETLRLRGLPFFMTKMFRLWVSIDCESSPLVSCFMNLLPVKYTFNLPYRLFKNFFQVRSYSWDGTYTSVHTPSIGGTTRYGSWDGTQGSYYLSPDIVKKSYARFMRRDAPPQGSSIFRDKNVTPLKKNQSRECPLMFLLHETCLGRNTLRLFSRL